MSGKKIIRAAIYTRKSSDEGLDQDFNSLDAQHEACAAYIASQRHEGWKRLPARYDDGGISGGTLERPALQRLLTEIEAGRIEMVVVYKIDRLTRSLADFAKLVERFEAATLSRIRSAVTSRSNCAKERSTLSVSLPIDEVVLNAWVTETKEQPAASKRSTSLAKSASDRVSLSIL